jgi:hypothetical protein
MRPSLSRRDREGAGREALPGQGSGSVTWRGRSFPAGKTALVCRNTPQDEMSLLVPRRDLVQAVRPFR